MNSPMYMDNRTIRLVQNRVSIGRISVKSAQPTHNNQKDPIMTPVSTVVTTNPSLHVADPSVDDVPPQPIDIVPTKALPSIMPPRFAVDRGQGAGMEPLRGVESEEEARAQIKKQVTMGTSQIVYIYALVGAEMAVQSSASLTAEQVELTIKTNASVLGL